MIWLTHVFYVCICYECMYLNTTVCICMYYTRSIQDDVASFVDRYTSLIWFDSICVKDYLVFRQSLKTVSPWALLSYLTFRSRRSLVRESDTRATDVTRYRQVTDGRQFNYFIYNVRKYLFLYPSYIGYFPMGKTAKHA